MKLKLLKCAFRVRSSKFLGFMVNQCKIEANFKKIKALLEVSSPKKPKEVMSLTGKVAALSRFMSQATNRCAPFFDVLKGSKRFEWTDNANKHFRLSKNISTAHYSYLSQSKGKNSIYTSLFLRKRSVPP